MWERGGGGVPKNALDSSLNKMESSELVKQLEFFVATSPLFKVLPDSNYYTLSYVIKLLMYAFGCPLSIQLSDMVCNLLSVSRNLICFSLLITFFSVKGRRQGICTST